MSQSYSVVIPAYYAEKTIEACIGSVVDQTLPPLEVIVIDDCSDDDTESSARRCEAALAAAGIGFEFFRMIRNAGPSAARNRGMLAAKGSFVAFLDADDIWAPNKLAIVDRFASRAGVGLVCHDYTAEKSQTLSAAGSAAYQEKSLSAYGMLLRNPAQTSCATVRMTNGLAFDETLRRCEDFDLWMRIAERSPVTRIVGKPLARLGRPQLSSGGLSGDTLGMRAGELRVYLNFCRRNWPYRIWLLPLLVVFSVSKHGYSWMRRRGKAIVR